MITFFLLRLIPGDPALQILGQHYTPAGAKVVRHSLGLDEPLWRQYLLFLQHLFQGNLGDSITFKQSAGSVIAERLPPTLFLVAYAATLAMLVSIPAGVISALRRGGIFDQVARLTTLVGFAMPAFWLGIILILIFSVHLQLFPVNGYGDTFLQHLDHLFLPAVTIALGFSTIVIRTLRSSTLAALSSDYVDTARIKGISRFAVLRKHVLRNAIVSVVVVFGINLAFLISGTVIVENVFAIPGRRNAADRLGLDARLPRRAGRDADLRVPHRGGQSGHRRRARVARPAGGPRMSTTMNPASASWSTRDAGAARSEPAAPERDADRRRHDPRHRDRRVPRRAALHELRPADTIDPLRPLAPPFSPGHILGTDQFGRDIWSRILYGGRIDLPDRVRRDGRDARRRNRDRSLLGLRRRVGGLGDHADRRPLLRVPVLRARDRDRRHARPEHLQHVRRDLADELDQLRAHHARARGRRRRTASTCSPRRRSATATSG